MNTQTRTKTRKAYNPGKPKGIAQHGDYKAGLFLVDSFREDNATYQVDLREGTCTCPHFEMRVAPKRENKEVNGEIVPDCKHLIAAREESYRLAWDKALSLSDDALETQSRRTDLRPETLRGIRSVQNLRREIAKIQSLEITPMEYCPV